MEMMRTEPYGDIEFFSNKIRSYSLLNIYYALDTIHMLTHWIITTPKSMYYGLHFKMWKLEFWEKNSV